MTETEINQKAAALFQRAGMLPNAFQKGQLGLPTDRGAGKTTLTLLRALAVALDGPERLVLIECDPDLAPFHAGDLIGLCGRLCITPRKTSLLPEILLPNASIIRFVTRDRVFGLTPFARFSDD